MFTTRSAALQSASSSGFEYCPLAGTPRSLSTARVEDAICPRALIPARPRPAVACHLAAGGVALAHHVQKPQRGLRRIARLTSQQNGAGAGAEQRAAPLAHFANGLLQAVFSEELQLRGALAAGQNQRV